MRDNYVEYLKKCHSHNANYIQNAKLACVTQNLQLVIKRCLEL